MPSVVVYVVVYFSWIYSIVIICGGFATFVVAIVVAAANGAAGNDVAVVAVVAIVVVAAVAAATVAVVVVLCSCIDVIPVVDWLSFVFCSVCAANCHFAVAGDSPTRW